ncbi:fibrillin-3 [Colossoma macropomum]|uniref:fibrillin-3 n=1 Tax=Colossoma macropomum TaxID=42526 RepID=UPI001863BAA7|nr:fibrillin-3 [Colossoma macropomum]
MDSCGHIVPFLLLILLHEGRSLRCACTTDLKTCASIHEAPADFQSAQNECRKLGGELMRAGSSHANETIETLLINTSGDFWSGLEAEDACSSNAIDLAACKQVCMSVSRGKNLTERACADKLDGFLCDGVSWDTCSLNMTEKVILLDKNGCSQGPCDVRCNPVGSGYTCGCLNNYRPSRINPQRCEYYCLNDTCKASCSQDNSLCSCPRGFVRHDDYFCMDINECESNHNCEQTCLNTIGSYECSCKEGYSLVNGSACVPRLDFYEGQNTPNTGGSVNVSSLNDFSGRVASPGKYAGISVTILAALFGLILLVRYLRKRKREEGVKEDCDVLNDAQQEL